MVVKNTLILEAQCLPSMCKVLCVVQHCKKNYIYDIYLENIYTHFLKKAFIYSKMYRFYVYNWMSFGKCIHLTT